jgi:hypothetical protein
MSEKHLLPLTFYFPKEMIKKLKKHFHMEGSNPNRSPQRYFKHNKTGRAKKSKEVHRTHTIFYIREKNRRKSSWVTLHSSEHHLAVKYDLNLPNLPIIAKV